MKLIFVDIDETLFFTNAHIHVIKDNKIHKKLSSNEFNNYELKDNESFDFSEFRSTDIFIKTAQPNFTMINLVIDLHNSGAEVAFLTARSDFDNPDDLIKFFKSFNIPIGHYIDNKIHIIRSGNYEFISDGPSRKKYIAQKILNKRNDITEIQLYDDNLKNLQEFKNINFPNRTFLVQYNKITEI